MNCLHLVPHPSSLLFAKRSHSGLVHRSRKPVTAFFVATGSHRNPQHFKHRGRSSGLPLLLLWPDCDHFSGLALALVRRVRVTLGHLPLPAGVAGGASFTVGAWVNWDGGADSQHIFDFGDGRERVRRRAADPAIGKADGREWPRQLRHDIEDDLVGFHHRPFAALYPAQQDNLVVAGRQRFVPEDAPLPERDPVNNPLLLWLQLVELPERTILALPGGGFVLDLLGEVGEVGDRPAVSFELRAVLDEGG